MDERVGWSQKKAECAEGERKLRQGDGGMSRDLEAGAGVLFLKTRRV